MNRRTFLKRVGGIAIGIPLVLQATACGSSSDDDKTGGATFSAANANDGSGHTHTLEISCTTLASDSATYTSSDAGGHTHSVTVSKAELTQILAGASVIVKTTDRHEHNWEIQMPAGRCA